ncbi:hypothetical protein [Streptosporangium sp. V21-05]|uniref:hypothetical protein n=1 Tax=Streptosporangium sp. V21-05 TaxID=3446115 RepID=UPI003F5340F6
MTGFLDELGKKLAERWLSLLVLPGLLYLAVLSVALIAGHGHALDPVPVTARVNAFAPASTGAVVLAAAAALAGAAGAGLAATALGRLTERLWTMRGRRWPARLALRRRTARWKTADDRFRRAVKASARTPDGPRRVAEAVAAREAVGLVEPARPTWIGDRLVAVERRVHTAYGLDLLSAWPRLWLVLPDSARTGLGVARDAYSAAARLIGWAILYLPLAAWWWPALPLSAAIGVTGWARARSATAALADLLESAVDLYGRDLAAQLGIETPGRLSREAGEAITIALRKEPPPRP